MEHELDQGAVETIHAERIWVICVGIISILSPFQEAEYDAVFLPNQRVPDAIESQPVALIHSLVLQSTRRGDLVGISMYEHGSPQNSNKIFFYQMSCMIDMHIFQ